jgi:MFS superfamily sulfate permease-like transporter
LSEATGSLGDLGTFVPITIGMVQIVGFDAGTVLLCTGLACIIAGVVFRIPMPVQPMKAIGALAIAGAMTATQAGVAGLAVGLFILVMAVTGLVGRLDKLIPRPVIRALQMVVGLLLLRSGVQLALFAPGSAALRPLWAVDGLAIVAVALVLTILLRRRLGWMALGLVVAGFLAAYIKEPGLFQAASVTLWRPALAHMDTSSLSGAWLGGLPQIPMTFLNSVLAISLLAGQLFPAGAGRTTPTKIAVSVGLMNLPIFALGGMPLCHGSGGLAAQHRFGARSSLAVIIRGAALLIIGLLFGRFALAWMLAFPASLLGVFLLIAGVGLARASQCWHTKPGLLAAIVMVAVHLVTGILVLGFVAGWITCVIVAKLAPRFEQFSDAEAPRA